MMCSAQTGSGKTAAFLVSPGRGNGRTSRLLRALFKMGMDKNIKPKIEGYNTNKQDYYTNDLMII